MEPDNGKTPWGLLVAIAAASGVGLWLAFRNGNSETKLLVHARLTAVSPFGPRGKDQKMHQGVDLYAPEGTPVSAAALGTVIMVGPTIGPDPKMHGYGEYIVLEHAGGVRTLYAHLSKGHVRKGQRISQGQNIGAVGQTAYGECGTYFCNDKPHLHFEVIPGAGAINPSLKRTEPIAWVKAQGMAPAMSQKQA